MSIPRAGGSSPENGLGPDVRLDEESHVIETIRQAAAALGQDGVRLGIGDDCAVLVPPAATEEIVVTTDQLIENTHFIRRLHPPAELGRKTIARGASDIAAMGARPTWFALSLCLPAELRFGWLEDYIDGLVSAISTFEVQVFPLVGGDVARGDFFAAHVTVAGAAPAGRTLRRSGARPGDAVWVSGELGGSALGLERLLAGRPIAGDAAIARHLAPTPRLALGQALMEWGATAALDLSDGLSTDTARLASASGVALTLDAERIPMFPEAGLARALHGGEEYELLFTAPASAPIPEGHRGLRLTRIGVVEAGAGLFLTEDGARGALEPAGYRHFAE
jgi:thiamine-monophosphate kinase